MNRETFICECSSTEHQIIISMDGDEDPSMSMCYAHIFLTEYSFFKRLFYGLKYIFGYKCKYGHFEEFIFNREDAPKLQKVVDFLNETNKEK